MPTLKERAPQLFEKIAIDSNGRPMDKPDGKGLVVLGPRTPSQVEVIKFILSTTRNANDDATANAIVNALKELASMPALAATAPAAAPPPPPAPPAPPKPTPPPTPAPPTQPPTGGAK